jgi:chitinase
MVAGSLCTVAVLTAACAAPDAGADASTPDEVGQEIAKSTRLPTRVVAGYWQGWGDPALRLRDVPKEYNVIMAAFAVGDRSGAVRFTQSVQSQASLVSDVKALHASGRRVVLAVGGWADGGLQIRNDAQLEKFVSTVTPIIDRYHFSGVDWDLEHGISPATIAEATFRLKKRYGPNFSVTMAPILGAPLEREQLDLARRLKGTLDMANPQYYNGGRPEQRWIVDHTLEWARVVGQGNVGMGFVTVKIKGETGQQSPAAICRMWQDLLVRAPKARGVMVWSINLDKKDGYRFARGCARSVRSS